MNAVGLDMLSEAPLSPRGRAALDAAAFGNRGAAHWRARKLIEARELLALAEIAPTGRMRIDYLDLADDLRTVCKLEVPVAVQAAEAADSGSVRIARGATIGLVYPEKALTQQLGGFSFVEVLEPRAVFHPAIASLPPFPQVMCLGDLPAGTRVTEIVFLAYAALAMQNLRLRGFESLGAMNIPATHWWQDHLSQLPLTRRAFLEAD
jgi:hypothetical protein